MENVKENGRKNNTLLYEGMKADSTYQLHKRYSNQELKDEPTLRGVLRNQTTTKPLKINELKKV